MSVWQGLNAPRNKREQRVAKIARDQERERIIALLEYTKCVDDCPCSVNEAIDEAISAIREAVTE